MALPDEDLIPLDEADEKTSLALTDIFPVMTPAETPTGEYAQLGTLLAFLNAQNIAAPATEVQIFASIAALRLNSRTISVSAVEGYYLAGDQGGGTFVYDSTDTTSPDDGAEIIVDAAGKRHKRQWSGWFDFRWAGAKGDGSTDNAVPILRTTYLGRKYGASAGGFNLLLPPGVYNFTAANTGYWWWAGFKKFRVSGYGATLKNTYNGVDGNLGRPLFSCLLPGLLNNSGSTFHGVLSGYPLSWLINNTAVGDTSFTTTTAADAGAWAAGDPVMLTSVDTQWLGYPCNPGQHEFHTVVSVNASTGVVVVDKPIQYRHLTTYPDGGVTAPGGVPCGKGRAWKLTTTATSVPDPLNFPSTTSLTFPWDIDHLYEGLTIPNSTMAPATYMAIMGRGVRFVDCTLIGMSPTIAGTVIFDNCTFTNTSEPDKLVDRVVINNCQSSYAIGFQSSSISHVDVNGGKLAAFGVGTAKYVTINSPDFDSFAIGSIYGMNRNVTVYGGTIRSFDAVASVFGTPNNHITGDISYANGTITMLKGASEQPYWGLIPGLTINLLTSYDGYSGDLGNGVITAIREDSTNVYFDTTWPWASLPAWAGTKVRIGGRNAVNVFGTTGCDSIRNLAEATKRGLKQWEFYRAQLLNFNTVGGAVSGMTGALTGLDINVRQVSTVAGRVLTIQCYMVKDDTFDDQQLLQIEIDLATRGRRTFDLTTITGMAVSDTAKFPAGGATITKLPAGRITPFGQLSWGHNITLPATYGQIPVVTMDVTMNTGMFCDTLVHDLDGTTNPITRVTGGVPG